MPLEERLSPSLLMDHKMNKEDKEDYSNLTYLPPPEKPREWDERFRKLIGINAATGEPWLRVVWGMDRKKFIAGVEEVWYIDPNGKYVGMPYLILEKWAPPQTYDRAEWEESRYDGTLDVLGAFPEKGVWDFLCTVRNEKMEPGGWDMAYRRAEEAVYNAEQPNARKRNIGLMIDGYKKRKEAQAEAHKEYRRQVQDELINEITKGEPNAAFNFATDRAERTYTKKNLRKKREQEEREQLADEQLPSSSFAILPHGLTIPKRDILGGH